MTQTPLSQDPAATKEVAAGLCEAGPLKVPSPDRPVDRLQTHLTQRLGLTAGAFLRRGSTPPAPGNR